MRSLKTPDGVKICYLGPDIELGPLPAVVYFALSAEESLSLAPYHQPAELLQVYPLRIFSFTIPGHGEGFDKFVALKYWAEQMSLGNELLEPFFEQTAQALSWLIDSNVVLPTALAVAGLSRGAFVATHVAARQPHVTTLLGFAPMTCVSSMPTFNMLPVDKLKPFDLVSLIPKLDHVKQVRFYIGNRDTLVGTTACFEFIQQLVEHGHECLLKNAIELMLTPSIGHHGHGTSSQIFAEGSAWLKNNLLER